MRISKMGSGNFGSAKIRVFTRICMKVFFVNLYWCELKWPEYYPSFHTNEVNPFIDF